MANKGEKVAVDPIRRLKDIEAIKKLLQGEPRNLLLFTLGINNGLRTGDLLRIKVGQVKGMKPGDEIQIEYIGLRPGEKLFEELFHEEEPLRSTDHEKVFLASYRKVDWAWLNSVLDKISDACSMMDAALLNARLRELVPERGLHLEKDAGHGPEQPSQFKQAVQN